MQHGITTSDSDIDPSSYDLRKGSKIGALITSANIYRKTKCFQSSYPFQIIPLTVIMAGAETRGARNDINEPRTRSQGRRTHHCLAVISRRRYGKWTSWLVMELSLSLPEKDK